MKGKKGQFAGVSDAFIYILLALTFALFLTIAILSADSDQDTVRASFADKDADAIIIGLMRTTVDADLDGDGQVDAETIADLIGMTDSQTILEENIRKAMLYTCNDEDYPCNWKLNIKGYNEIESGIQTQRNFPYKTTSTIYIPTTNAEVKEVELTLQLALRE